VVEVRIGAGPDAGSGSCPGHGLSMKGIELAYQRRWIAPSQIAREIRQHRGAAGLSQRGLADAAGLSIGALRDLEQGRTCRPRRETVDGLAAALGLDARQRDQLRLTRTPGTWRPAHGRGSTSAQPPCAVQLRILGPVAATISGVPIDLRSARPRAVLGLLALCCGADVRPDDLTDLLWGSRPPVTAATAVQGYVSRLRRTLRPGPGSPGRRYLVAWTGRGYRLQVGEDCQLDSTVFSQLANRGHDAMERGDHVRSVELYERSLSMWQGRVLDDIEPLHDHPVVVDLNRQRSDVAIRYADAAARTRTQDRVLPHLRDLCARECFNERAFARLMAALAATGQRAAAIAEFESLRARLDRELGIRPDRQVTAAYAAIAATA
jgi:DNA-binding SARP family transcriptional activator/DNA-binding XRE family transcriptional regulator